MKAGHIIYDYNLSTERQKVKGGRANSIFSDRQYLQEIR